MHNMLSTDLRARSDVYEWGVWDGEQSNGRGTPTRIRHAQDRIGTSCQFCLVRYSRALTRGRVRRDGGEVDERLVRPCGTFFSAGDTEAISGLAPAAICESR